MSLSDVISEVDRLHRHFLNTAEAYDLNDVWRLVEELDNFGNTARVEYDRLVGDDVTRYV